MKNKKDLKIGFIGQGWIGKNYADYFEEVGFKIVRYSVEKKYVKNKEKIRDCDIVFIAVPTPTTTTGFDDSIVRNVVKLVGSGKIAIIKSTLVPGTTESIQKENPSITIFHSPEFLREQYAREDTFCPERNIIGLPIDDKAHSDLALSLIEILPPAEYNLVCKSIESELIKYAGNCFLFTKVVFMNMLYDLSLQLGAEWTTVQRSVSKDKRIGNSHTQILDKNGRGAGGHCFIKDFEAFIEMYSKNMPDDFSGNDILKQLRNKNNELLTDSGKDLDLLKGIYE